MPTSDAYTARAEREAAAIIANNGTPYPLEWDYRHVVNLVAQAWLAGYGAALESLAERIEP